jgi:hypothetical protein
MRTSLKGIAAVAVATLTMSSHPASAFTPDRVQLKLLGSYQTGVFDEGAAEIAAFDPLTDRLFFVNANAVTVDVLDLSDPASPVKISSIDVTDQGAGANSVDVYDGIVAVAVEGASTTSNGKVAFYDTDGTFLNAVTVGVLPDMLTFSHDGTKVLVANEGEPSDDYTADPAGSVSIVDLSAGVGNATVQTAGFTAWDGQEATLRAQGVRIFGPGSSTSQDLEPEYIGLSADGKTAWVALQENNALGVLDVDSATITAIVPLGFKDHSRPGRGMDASNRDDAINITTWPTKGMYQPDAIATYSVGGKDYIVTANEGDARDYDGYSEEARVKDLTLDPTAFPDRATLQLDENLGRLNSTTAIGDIDGDGDHDIIYSYGARSFSIWGADGTLVWDSGDQFEQRIADILPDNFNATNDENNFDNRSDDKGPEPEGVVIGWIDGRAYAFIGLERVGGIMVYDITNPHAPSYVTYVIHRDFSVAFDPDAPTTEGLLAIGDMGPEGLVFISADDSPTGTDLLVVANEVTGSISTYEIAVAEGFQGVSGSVIDRSHAALMATVTDLGTPLPNLTLEVSRAVAGRAADFAWTGTTDADGSGVVEVEAPRVSGLYTVRATDGAGTVVGTWSSVPLNGGLQTDVILTTGESAFVQQILPLPAAKGAAATPTDAALGNFPNPFNPETQIHYTVSQPGQVTLRIFNSVGQPIRTLVQEAQSAGRYEIAWNGRDGAGRAVASGVYYLRLQLPTEEMELTRAMNLLR